MMDKIAKHKETILFASCAVALVGSVLLLQKATTPSQHRRHAGSSVSRGVPRSRPASRGPAGGARSRSSSRVRSRSGVEKESGPAPSSTNPVAAAAAAAAGERSHGSRIRDPSQPHAHRHHSSQRNLPPSTTTPNGATATKSAAATAASSEPKRTLTVEAVAQHKKALGTANALQRPDQAETASAALLHRDVRTSGGGRTGGSVGDDGAYHRSASNAATVGSQAFLGAPPTTTGSAVPIAPAVDPRGEEEVAGAESTKAILPPRSPRLDNATPLPAAVPPVSADSRTGAHKKTAAPRTFLTDHGTQTELTTGEGEDGRTRLFADETPHRWMQTGMPSPIAAAAAGEANNSTLLNCTGLGWTPVRETDQTKPMNTVARTGQSGDDVSLLVVPRYFVSRLEAQVRALVHHIVEHDAGERAWMQLYVYLSELPLPVRKILTERDRCGVTSSFVSLAITMAQELRHSYVRNDVEAEEDEVAAAATSLPQEVLHLLQQGTPRQTAMHFKLRGGSCVCVDGVFIPDAKGHRRSARFAHVQLSTSSSSSSRSTSAHGSADSADGHGDGGALSTVVAIVKHLEKYRAVVQAAESTSASRIEAKDDGDSEDGGATAEAQATTPLQGRDDSRLAETTQALEQLHAQQQQLASLLAAFLQLRYTEEFQAMRQTVTSAPFACDFIELTAAAQRLLEGGALSPDHLRSSTLPQLQVPPTQRRVMRSESTTDARDTSIGTTTSVRSDSTLHAAAAGAAAPTQPRRSLKARTPMKPSIRYPIQRVVSNAPSPVAASSQLQ